MRLAILTWDPDRNFFVVPYINHPVTWYGVLFAFGFLVGYFLVRKIFGKFLEDPKLTPAETRLGAVLLTDRLALLVVIGTIVGARLGHVFFYGWPYYKQNPIAIFKIWEGGLASHGGAVGVLIGLFVFVWWNRRLYKKLTFLVVLDVLVIPAAFAGGCIRIGNFINQEIAGIPTNVPWGVIFTHPTDGIPGVPLHPVQLYESITYFLVFGLLFTVWKRHPDRIGRGLFSGLFFTLVFGLRFVWEYFKMPLSQWLDAGSLISMGQLLSIPFILLGIALLILYYFRSKNDAISRS